MLAICTERQLWKVQKAHTFDGKERESDSTFIDSIVFMGEKQRININLKEDSYSAAAVRLSRKSQLTNK